MRKRRKFNKEEERQHPDSPGGLEVVAAKNRPFAERFVGVFILAKAGVKKDGGR
ncbi:hypothetical protein JHU04_002476 [Brenneria sp. 4F2]|nr:hypothetical protein [Brenneria bubanii]